MRLSITLIALIAALLVATAATVAAARGFHSNLHNQKELYWDSFRNFGEDYRNITASQLYPIWRGQSEDTFIVDVRETGEYAEAHIPRANNFPLSTLDTDYVNLPTDKTLYVHCLGGVRSIKAIQLLLTKSVQFTLVNIQDGFNGWVNGGYPVEKNTTVQKSNKFESFVEALYSTGFAQRPQKNVEAQQAVEDVSFDSYLSLFEENKVEEVGFDSYLSLFDQSPQQPQPKQHQASKKHQNWSKLCCLPWSAQGYGVVNRLLDYIQLDSTISSWEYCLYPIISPLNPIIGTIYVIYNMKN